MNSDERCLPVESTSIEEILRNARSTNLPGEHYVPEEETDNHANRLSTNILLSRVAANKEPLNMKTTPLKSINSGFKRCL
jgi:hypothetical protein